MEASLQRLLHQLQQIKATKNRSFEDVKGLVPTGLGFSYKEERRDDVSDVQLRLILDTLVVDIDFTTDMRTFNVYQSTVDFGGKTYMYSHRNGMAMFAQPDDIANARAAILLAKVVNQCAQLY